MQPGARSQGANRAAPWIGHTPVQGPSLTDFRDLETPRSRRAAVERTYDNIGVWQPSDQIRVGRQRG